VTPGAAERELAGEGLAGEELAGHELAGEGLAEHELAGRVVSALLREDYGGLSGAIRPDGPELTLHLPGCDGPGPVLPLERDGFLADYRVAAGTPVTLDDVRSAVAVLAGPRDADGAAVFDAECRRTLAEAGLRARHPSGPRGYGQGGSWRGAAGQLRYDALAAALPHPAYPASPCRLGLDDQDLLAYAPEFWPDFELRWAAVPRAAITRPPGRRAGLTGGRDRPAWWPAPARVGLPAGLAATHELFPVHPLTARGALPAAMAALTATAGPVLAAPEPYLRVRPTLSVRTVAVAGHPADHLKLPLPASTLGARNRRSIAPGTLADGALVCRILATLRDRDPGLAGLLLADDTGYAHAGHPDLGYLWRRLPPGLDERRVVPVAALVARAPSGRLVIDELARQAERAGTRGPASPGPDGGRRVVAFAAGYFRLVLGLAVRLLVGYGIALESHQQNAALVAGPGNALSLLVKDFDGALVNLARLRSALGPAAPERADFADQRLLSESDDALADVFVTITVHLCAGALAFGLAARGTAPLDALLAAARRALRDALDAERPGPVTALLRARALDPPRLAGKSMLSAGTLTAKEHTGASDINKFYGTNGPNYLRETL
jgi:siderophore synthetase component